MKADSRESEMEEVAIGIVLYAVYSDTQMPTDYNQEYLPLIGHRGWWRRCYGAPRAMQTVCLMMVV
jgi:hypothetical protein